MSYIQLESQQDLREKHVRRNTKKTIAITALVTGTIILGVLLIGGFFHPQALGIDPPGGLGTLERSIAIRPDYTVSSFIYDRRSFRWFIGTAAKYVTAAFSIYGLATACIAITGGVTAVGCVAGAVGVVGAVYGLIPSGSSSPSTVATNDLELGNMAEVEYVNSFGGNGKRATIGAGESDLSDHIPHLLRKALGPDYKFEGHIPVNDTRHAHLIAANEGRPVPVSSFTSSAGIRFHHATVFDKKRNGHHHRFGFAPPANSKRQAAGSEAEASNDYFSSGGLDAFDCAASSSSDDHLNAGDAANMGNLIQCNINNYLNATEISVQVYDADTEETIGAGIMAPFDSDGTSSISGDTGNSADCPTALPSNNSCADDDSSGS